MEALRLTHRAPPVNSTVRRFIWKWRVRLESSFVFAMLEPWECALIWSILLFLTSLVYISVVTYLPSHMTFLRRRFAYYVYGDENAALFAGLWWVGREAGRLVGVEGWEEWRKLVGSKGAFGEGVGFKGEL